MSLKITRKKYPYRPAVLGVVVDEKQRFLLVQKVNYKKNEWSFPGGGVEGKETLKQAVIRELEEELGCQKFKVIKESKIPYYYEWPKEAVLRRFKKNGEFFRGQKIKHFLVKFRGDKNEIKLQPEEIRTAKWITLKELPKYLTFPGQWLAAQKVLWDFHSNL